LEGRFFISSVFGVESGLSRGDTRLSMQVFLGAAREARKKDLFSFQPLEGPRCLAFISFKLGGGIRKIIFSVFLFS